MSRTATAAVVTVGITPAIADTTASLPSSFPGDPADRLIHATAIERGWHLVTKDGELLAHHSPGQSPSGGRPAHLTWRRPGIPC